MSIFRRKSLLSTYLGQNKNPIYIEYYSHTACDCYKIDLPWSRYCKYTMVLCEVSAGLKYAKKQAKRVIMEHLTVAIAEPLCEVGSDSVWFVVAGIMAVVCILALIGSLVSFFV